MKSNSFLEAKEFLHCMRKLVYTTAGEGALLKEDERPIKKIVNLIHRNYREKRREEASTHLQLILSVIRIS